MHILHLVSVLFSYDSGCCSKPWGVAQNVVLAGLCDSKTASNTSNMHAANNCYSQQELIIEMRNPNVT